MRNKVLALVVMSVLFLGFLSSGQYRWTGSTVKRDVEVEKLSCGWKGDEFEVCASVRWDRGEGEFLKVLVNGAGVGLGGAPRFVEEQVGYCTGVGGRTGVRSVNLYVYDAGGKLVLKDFDHEVSCARGGSERVVPGGFRKKFFFVARANQGRYEGSGVHAVELPGKPVRCEVRGSYETYQKDARHARCDGGTGEFSGVVDEGGQGWVNDAHLWYWFGFDAKGKVDPPPVESDGSMKVLLCDTQYLERPENFVQVKVVDFSDDLVLGWVYKSNVLALRADLHVKGELVCALESPRVEVPRRVRAVAPEVPEVVVESVGEDEEVVFVDVGEAVPFEPVVEEPVEVRGVGLWRKIVWFFASLF